MKIVNIGDPHLGRLFRTGVPLHRRGEREASVWAEFERLMAEPADLTVCVGDLLDKMVVPPEVVLRAADITWGNSAYKLCVFLRGNHDASRDADRRSSFDLFEHLLMGNLGVIVVSESAYRLEVQRSCLLFCPWHPFKTAAQIVEEAPDGPYDTIYGHWDLESYGSDNPNLIPIPQLKAKLAPGGKVITGHDHTARTLVMDGIEVTVTGSMLPYSHGEDPTGRIYVTVPRDELDPDLSVYHDKCLRVLLKPGQTLPEEVIDCLALTVKRVGAEGQEEDLNVEIDPFDLKKLFDESMEAEGLDKDFQAKVWAKFQEHKHD